MKINIENSLPSKAMMSIWNLFVRIWIVCSVVMASAFVSSAQPRNGEHKVYDANGKLVESGYYKRGMKKGVWMQYDPSNGLVVRKTTFDKGVRQGPELVYNKSNGKVREANWYRNDTLHGMRYVYSRTGTLDSILQYRNGRLYGLQRIYKIGGRVVLNKMQYILNDTIVYERRYDGGGELDAIEYFKNGKLEGECRYYNTYYYGTDTAAARICNYKNGLKDGEEKEYRNDGVLYAITSWRGGVKHGKSLMYQYGNRVAYEVDYVNGSKNGVEHFYYYSDSVLYSHRFNQYKMDQRDGLQAEIKAKGDTVAKRWYHDGMFDSSVTYQYNKEGKLYMDFRTTLVLRNESNARYFIQYWSSDGAPYYDVTAVSSREGKESYMNYDGKMTKYYPSAKRHYEMWWKNGKRDSLCSGWYQNGKAMFSCKVKSEKLAARPEIWNEQGVKLKAGSKEYNQLFGEEIATQLWIDKAVYDPADDNIIYVIDEGDDAVAMEIAEDGMDEHSLSWNRNDQTVYSEVDELPRYTRAQEGFSEYMLSTISPEYFWMKNFANNDSIVVSFVVKGSGSVGDVKAEHVPVEQSALGIEVVRLIKATVRWTPARIAERPVNCKMRYVLRFSELNAMISGSKETTR